jgi:hypothetical protein
MGASNTLLKCQRAGGTPAFERFRPGGVCPAKVKVSDVGHQNKFTRCRALSVTLAIRETAQVREIRNSRWLSIFFTHTYS